MSALPPLATGQQTSWIGSFVPKAEVLPQARDVRSSPDSDRRFQIGVARGRGSHPTADWSGSSVISFTCAARELGYQYSN